MGTARRATVAAGAALAAVGAAAVLGGDEPPASAPRTDAVLYGIGLSTDPYGSSRPRGVGVAFGVQGGRPRTAVRRGRELRNVSWLADGRAVALDFPGGVPRHRVLDVDGAVRDAGPPPLGRRAIGAIWSPDRRWIAHLRAVPCERAPPRVPCYTAGRRTFVRDARRASTPPVAVPGQAIAWTPAGGLVMVRGADLEVADRSGRRTTLLSGAEVARRAGARRPGFLSAPSWSPDGRFVAAIAHLRYPRAAARRRVGTVVVASADGRIARVFHSPYAVSMLAWAPSGHRLAWTTSGFPDPHELMVADLDRRTPPRRLLATERHFDWVAWSPDARLLLVDDENDGGGSWRLVPAGGLARPRVLERLGGRPQWCCPQNAFTTADGAWSGGVR